MSGARAARNGASCLLSGVGAALVLLAVLSAAAAAVALVDRARFGRGIMFADVEVLALVAAACAVPGVAALAVGARLGKR